MPSQRRLMEPIIFIPSLFLSFFPSPIPRRVSTSLCLSLSLSPCIPLGTKGRLLLGAGGGREVRDPVLDVELDGDLVAEAGRAPVQTARLDAGGAGHGLELGVEARAAVAAEEVPVVLARGALDVVGLGGACFAGMRCQLLRCCFLGGRFRGGREGG